MSEVPAIVRFFRYVVRFPSSFFVLLFVVASGSAHVLIGRWARRSFPRVSPRVIWGIVFFFWLVPLASRLVSRRTSNPIVVNFFGLSMLELVAVIVALPFLLILEIAHLVQERRRKNNQISKGTSLQKAVVLEGPPAAEARAEMGRRELIERSAGLALLSGAGSVLGWGMIRGRHEYQIEEVVVRIKGLPRALDGYTMAQISDIHVGAFVGERDLDLGFDLIRQIKPDLLLLTGDLVDNDASFAPKLAAKLRALPRPRDGMVGIVGNHDYYSGVGEVVDVMRGADVRMLINKGMRVREQDGGGFALLGIDDLWAARNGGVGPNLEEALADVPPDLPRILLSHQPTFFFQASSLVQLQLSGHTHGGQVNPGFRIAELFMPFVSGRYLRGDSTLWVNRGFGVAGPPTRVFAPPEVTKVVLVAA